MIDDEDRARARATMLLRDRMWVATLRGIVRRGTYEHAFLDKDPEYHDDVDTALLRRLVWHYRRSFPSGTRMTTNPADPIVQEREPQDA